MSSTEFPGGASVVRQTHARIIADRKIAENENVARATAKPARRSQPPRRITGQQKNRGKDTRMPAETVPCPLTVFHIYVYLQILSLRRIRSFFDNSGFWRCAGPCASCRPGQPPRACPGEDRHGNGLPPPLGLPHEAPTSMPFSPPSSSLPYVLYPKEWDPVFSPRFFQCDKEPCLSDGESESYYS